MRRFALSLSLPAFAHYAERNSKMWKKQNGNGIDAYALSWGKNGFIKKSPPSRSNSSAWNPKRMVSFVLSRTHSLFCCCGHCFYIKLMELGFLFFLLFRLNSMLDALKYKLACLVGTGKCACALRFTLSSHSMRPFPFTRASSRVYASTHTWDCPLFVHPFDADKEIRSNYHSLDSLWETTKQNNFRVYGNAIVGAHKSTDGALIRSIFDLVSKLIAVNLDLIFWFHQIPMEKMPWEIYPASSGQGRRNG